MKILIFILLREISWEMLDHHAYTRQKFGLGNDTPFMTKA